MSDTDQAIRDVIKGAGVVYVGLFLELVIAFVAQVLAAQYLSVSGFGGLTTGTALLDIGATVAGFGLTGGLTRYLPRIEREQKRSLVTTAVGVTLANSILVGGLVALGAPVIASEVFGDPSVTVSIQIFGAAIPFSALLNVVVGGIRGEKESLYQVYIKNITQPLVRFFLVVVAIVLGLDQAGIAGAYALPYVVTSILALALLYRSLPTTKYQLDPQLTKRVARYSVPFIASGLAGFIYRSMDIFIILYYLDSLAVGIYGVAYAAVSFMQMFSTAFNFLGAPIASELEHNKGVKEVMDVFRPIARWLAVGSICTFVPLGIFSTEFISVIYGTKYADGGMALTVLALGYAAQNVLSVHDPILQSLGKSRLLAFNSVFAAVVNLGLNILLIPEFGIVGAAVATGVSFVLRDGLAAAEVRYLLETTPIYWNVFGPTLLSIPILGGFTVIIAPKVPTTIFWLIISSGTICILYCVLVLLIFGITQTEKMILYSAEEKYGLPIPDVLVDFFDQR